MIWYDAEFWMRYYRWALHTPVDRELARLTHSVQMVQLTLLDNFTPTVRRVAWVFEDFGFAMTIGQEPVWRRIPLRVSHAVRVWTRRFR